MSTQWFCRILHEEFGPLDIDELRELASSGTLDPGDLVRRDTEDVWTAASKCLELRVTFRQREPAEKTQPTRDEIARPTRTESASGERTARRDRVSDEDLPSAAITPSDLSVPATPRQRWIAWSATAGLMLALFFADRLIASATPTFPQPRQVREQLAGRHWFLGTGPWSPWECRLLWLDSFVVLGFVSFPLSKRLAR